MNTIKKKKVEHKEIDEIKQINNPFQAILLILAHPKFYLPVIVIMLIIFTFLTMKFNYDKGQFTIEKTELKINQLKR